MSSGVRTEGWKELGTMLSDLLVPGGGKLVPDDFGARVLDTQAP
jgi:hypothetical protein